jgi:hypothetical protein
VTDEPQTIPGAATVIAAAALVFVELHGPSGHPIEVNPAEVSSLREPMDIPSGHWTKGTRCIVVMTNRMFYGVAEDCTTVERMLEAGK